MAEQHAHHHEHAHHHHHHGEGFFNEHAASWDTRPEIVAMGKKAADTFLSLFPTPTDQLDVMDFGTGTGLIALNLAPHVKSVLCVDTASKMLEALTAKQHAQGLTNVTTLCREVKSVDDLDGRKFDVIVSSMTMHHLDDPAHMINVFAQALNPGGMFMFTDIKHTQVSHRFHSHHAHKHAGVFHSGGFPTSIVAEWFVKAGLTPVRVDTAFTTTKKVSKVEGEAEDPEMEFEILIAAGRK